MPAPDASDLDHCTKPLLSHEPLRDLLDAMGELDAYLCALDDAQLLPFTQQLQLKDYVMQGWRNWRTSSTALGV